MMSMLGNGISSTIIQLFLSGRGLSGPGRGVASTNLLQCSKTLQHLMIYGCIFDDKLCTSLSQGLRSHFSRKFCSIRKVSLFKCSFSQSATRSFVGYFQEPVLDSSPDEPCSKCTGATLMHLVLMLSATETTILRVSCWPGACLVHQYALAQK